jgi:hypothetical protein
MVGQLGQVGLGTAGAKLGQRLTDPLVEAPAPEGDQLVVERLAHERVGEPVPSPDVAVLDH